MRFRLRTQPPVLETACTGLGADSANADSLRLLARLGFQREGLFRQRWRVYGQWQDSVMLGLLNPDWLPARQR